MTTLEDKTGVSKGGNAAIAVVHIKQLTFCYRPVAVGYGQSGEPSFAARPVQEQTFKNPQWVGSSAYFLTEQVGVLTCLGWVVR